MCEQDFLWVSFPFGSYSLCFMVLSLYHTYLNSVANVDFATFHFIPASCSCLSTCSIFDVVNRVTCS